MTTNCIRSRLGNHTYPRQYSEDYHYSMYVIGSWRNTPPGAQEAAVVHQSYSPLFCISAQRNGRVPKGSSIWRATKARQLELCFLPLHSPHRHPVPSSDPVEPEGFKWATGGRRIIKKMENSGFWPKGNSSKCSMFQNRNNWKVKISVGEPRSFEKCLHLREVWGYQECSVIAHLWLTQRHGWG